VTSHPLLARPRLDLQRLASGHPNRKNATKAELVAWLVKHHPERIEDQ
jgi:hypothetical protein